MGNGEYIKVFIADDSSIIRTRLIDMLSDLEEIEVVGEAGDVLETIDSVRQLKPEAVILDLQMPGGNGIEALRAIKHEERAPVMIMLTNYSCPQCRRKCLEAGADFFFDKTTEFEKVVEVFKEFAEARERVESRAGSR